ncbi:MAG: M15 family metallopeptidase [Cocleimonas sp.]|nr:M15 family metallopeptidase [Cocleimonas sp.]
MSRFTKLVAIPEETNQGLRGTNNTIMLSVLGSPSDRYQTSCSHPTNRQFLKHVVSSANVGPFKVSGYHLAVTSLKEVMEDIKQEQPDIYSGLAMAGMLCCRYVRGSRSSISNHSWGTAIDIKIDNRLDQRGNNKVQLGLTLIAPIFNRHGWYWGAGFPTEDAMHFEISREKIKEWFNDGKMPPEATYPPEYGVTLGERSNEVRDIQLILNKFGHNLIVDGIYDAATRAAIISLQASFGVRPDGIVDTHTLTKIKEKIGFN